MDDTTDQTVSLPTTAPHGSAGGGSGRHPVNIGHLVMGIAFLGLAVIWALIESGTASATDLRWLLPVPWVAAGAVGLAATAPRLRGHRD
ncbi:hypothetical protein [Nocardioides cynanchi]|uniref:hypothetical protein n=1 Tax=Nocardioides cynanchi TaxID=2558918 RepID=UPI001248C8D4|nr:hypothetical protein [Nocardioides cynanchi]